MTQDNHHHTTMSVECNTDIIIKLYLSIKTTCELKFEVVDSSKWHEYTKEKQNV